jgi:hypothetical protein
MNQSNEKNDSLGAVNLSGREKILINPSGRLVSKDNDAATEIFIIIMLSEME